MNITDCCVICGKPLPLTMTRIGNRCLGCEDAPITQREIIDLFLEASTKLFEWYDGERGVITEKGYVCPTATGTHGMTMLRTAVQQFHKSSYDYPSKIKT